ncbi:Got1/Sft2-like family-domain-containing protein [Haematococcus lacustris]
MFRLFGNSQASQAESTSLLADWQTYSRTHDVEAAAPSTSESNLFQSVDKTSSNVGNFLQTSFASVSSRVTSGMANLPTTESFSIPSSQQLIYFFAFLAAGGVFLLLAFMLFLPVIILSPSKFALSFTLGCTSIMVGFAQLRGWRQQLKHMMSQERLLFSCAYMGSIVATLYVALVMHSYLLCVICSGLQVVTLLYYLMSYFPGGTQGVKLLLGLFGQAVMSCFGNVQRMLLK